MSFVENMLDGIDTVLTWVSSGLKQTVESYCDIHTADSETALAANDGSLMSLIEIQGVNMLIGTEEFAHIHQVFHQCIQSSMGRPGHSMQFFFNYDNTKSRQLVEKNFEPAMHTAEVLQLDMKDLFRERVDIISNYCAEEKVYLAIWTGPSMLTGEEQKASTKEKMEMIKENHIPAFRYTQNYFAAIPALRDAHDSFVRSIATDLASAGVVNQVMNVHDACWAIRSSFDRSFTSDDWQAVLPGDKIKIKIAKRFRGDPADVMWPSLAHQLLPRDAFNLDIKTCQVGDTAYSTVFIDLFPQQIQPFIQLFNKILASNIPWRMSLLINGGGMESLKIKRSLSSLLSFASAQNRLINESVKYLDYISLNTDDAVVKLRVAASTWADSDDLKTLRLRTAQLAKAIQGWGSCDVSEMCGDPFAGIVSSSLGLSQVSSATTTVAALNDVITMLPMFRPTSPWEYGALLLRSPDGKASPYQPGSSLQTTWIDLMYAKPGSGKSVLSNALNLALCMNAGISDLPRIAIIDIGPSSSGLISLLQEALPREKKSQVLYKRLTMDTSFSINPFDTILGARLPQPQNRAFLVNFISLLVTPVETNTPYEGMSEMIGLIVDLAYKMRADNTQPNIYSPGIEEIVDALLDEISFVSDAHTSWWEVTDALFNAGYQSESKLAQRNAVPIIADLATIARENSVADLYSNVKIPTGENIIDAFIRMISSAIREYPILSQVTRFDISDARIVSLDLDEVAKTGGASADRQTAVMYMIARYVLAQDFYLNETSITNVPKIYHDYHKDRIDEISKNAKRIVMDEFHRTQKSQAVRDQVIVDMREGRKWNVQICLISQSIDDFTDNMIEFATSVFIMDAGNELSIKKTSDRFGLNQTSIYALKNSVHGPREGGGTFLAKFSTKYGNYTQLLTLTLGPIELWAFSTTAEDSVLRNKLYDIIGAKEARKLLAQRFPGGSAKKYIENKVINCKESTGMIEDQARENVIDEVVQELLQHHHEE